MPAKDNLLQDQMLAKSLLDKIVHIGCLNETKINYHLAPLTVFNGDFLLAGSGSDDSLHLFLGDFSGHGFTAAIGAFPVSYLFYKLVSLGFEPENIIKKINEYLFDFLPKNMFLACAYIVFNNEEKSFKIFNFGMPDPYVLRWQNPEEPPIFFNFPAKEMALGIVSKDKLKVVFEKFFFEEEDRLLLYSDGVSERKNLEGLFLGRKKIETILLKIKKENQIIPLLLNELQDFSNGAVITDDLALVEMSLGSDLFKYKEDDQLKKLDNLLSSPLNGDGSFSVQYSYSKEFLVQISPLPIVFNYLLQYSFLTAKKRNLCKLAKNLYINVLALYLKLNSSLPSEFIIKVNIVKKDSEVSVNFNMGSEEIGFHKDGMRFAL